MPGAGHESTVWALAFNTSGSQMVSSSADATLRIWNCTSNADGEQLPPVLEQEASECRMRHKSVNCFSLSGIAAGLDSTCGF